MTADQKAQTVIAKILQQLITEYQPLKVILFGSYAQGMPNPDSDIDLLIIKDSSARFLDRWTEVQAILTGMHHSLPVETLVLTPQEINLRLSRGDQFIAGILSNGEILYAA